MAKLAYEAHPRRRPLSKRHVRQTCRLSETCVLTSFGTLGTPFTVTICQNRLPKAVVEAGLRSQEAGHQEVEQAPEFDNIILNWGTGQDQTVVGLHCLDSFGELGLRILDNMSLVKDAVVPILLAQVCHVVSNHVIRCNDHVVFGEGIEKLRAIAGGSNVLNGAEVGCIL